MASARITNSSQKTGTMELSRCLSLLLPCPPAWSHPQRTFFRAGPTVMKKVPIAPSPVVAARTTTTLEASRAASETALTVKMIP